MACFPHLRASVHSGFHRGQWVVCFGHFAYVGIELGAGHVIPSSGLKQRGHLHQKSLQRMIKDFDQVHVVTGVYLVYHLHTVLVEPVVVVGLPRGPVSEGRHVFVRPGKHPGHNQVSQTRPHVTGGCINQPRKKCNSLFTICCVFKRTRVHKMTVSKKNNVTSTFTYSFPSRPSFSCNI